VTFDGFDVVVTPFPFADRGVQRKRPALVLSSRQDFGSATGVAIIAMITTGRASQWPFDVPISDLEAAGLRHACLVRMKLATLSFERIGAKIGRLAERDARAVSTALGRMFPVAPLPAGPSKEPG
jgi:mRNA interferase MazF